MKVTENKVNDGALRCTYYMMFFREGSWHRRFKTKLVQHLVTNILPTNVSCGSQA